nr:XRE family transcriptional regulator [uncultured Alistipes sp.]
MIHIGQLIEAELRRQERTITWFAKKLFCDRTNVYNIFKRQSIDTETLLRISQILHHDFFVHYREEIENHIEDPLSDPQNGKP